MIDLLKQHIVVKKKLIFIEINIKTNKVQLSIWRNSVVEFITPFLKPGICSCLNRNARITYISSRL